MKKRTMAILMLWLLAILVACSEKQVTFSPDGDTESEDLHYLLMGTGSGDGNPKADIYMDFAAVNEVPTRVAWRTIRLEIQEVFLPEAATCNATKGKTLSNKDGNITLDILEGSRSGLRLQTDADMDYCSLDLHLPAVTTPFFAEGVTPKGETVRLGLQLERILSFLPPNGSYRWSSGEANYWLSVLDLSRMLPEDLLNRIVPDQDGLLRIDTLANEDLLDELEADIRKAFALYRDENRNRLPDTDELEPSKQIGQPNERPNTPVTGREAACHVDLPTPAENPALLLDFYHAPGWPRDCCDDPCEYWDRVPSRLYLYRNGNYRIEADRCNGAIQDDFTGTATRQQIDEALSVLNDNLPALACFEGEQNCFDADGGHVYLYEDGYSDGIGFEYYCVDMETVSAGAYSAYSRIRETMKTLLLDLIQAQFEEPEWRKNACHVSASVDPPQDPPILLTWRSENYGPAPMTENSYFPMDNYSYSLTIYQDYTVGIRHYYENQEYQDNFLIFSDTFTQTAVEEMLAYLNPRVALFPCHFGEEIGTCYDVEEGGIQIFEPQYDDGIGFTYFCLEAMEDGDPALLTAFSEIDAYIRSVYEETVLAYAENMRTPVNETEGFCKTNVEIDDSCNTAEDCVGYRVAAPVNCCDVSPVNPTDCRFANRRALPLEERCAADAACDTVPFFCYEGHCIAGFMATDCTSTDDCKLVEAECACVAMNTEMDTENYFPNFTADSCAEDACPESARPLCLVNGDGEGQCVAVGEYMDPFIETYCDWAVSFCDSMGICDREACISGLKANDYTQAASQWLLIQAAPLASTFGGFMSGPGAGWMECLTVSCP